MRPPPPLRRELLLAFSVLFLGAVVVVFTGLTFLLPFFETPTRGLLLAVGLITGVLVVLFLSGGAYLRRVLLRPMNNLAADARLIAEGDIRHRVRDADSAELLHISQSVNAMADRLIADQEVLAENVRSLDATNRELVGARDQVLHSARLASVGTLAAGIAHEVGNPLGAIMAFVDVARGRAEKQDQDPELLNAIRTEASRIDTIVRGLLDYARPREAVLGPAPPAAVLDRVRDLLETQGKLERVAVTWAVAGEIPEVVMEPARLEQVLVNLLLNALDALEGTREPRLTVDLRVEEGEVSQLPSRRANDPPGIDYMHRRRVSKDDGGRGIDPLFTARRVVVLQVADNGPGIPEEDLINVFDPFFTTKEPGRGTGLGLSICARLVEGMGGRIEAENSPEGGARFHIRLPAVAEAAPSEATDAPSEITQADEMPVKILIIDDDAGLRKSLGLILGDAGYDVVQAEDGEMGLAVAADQCPELILCDVRMPKVDGLEFLERYGAEGGEALVLVMTAYGSMELAVEALKKGAYDYLPKPFGADEVLLTVKKAEEREHLRQEVGRLRKEVEVDRRFGEIVAGSTAMRRALVLVEKVARHSSPVLVTGASGTGKELVARLIHRESPRADRAFVPVNCGGIPETLLESEFFGFVKGAFTGADRDKAGLFEAADGGTLFLDEIGELSALQVKLLRALQEGEVRRLGSTTTTRVDTRIISATNLDLEGAVEAGDFRQDLYYRLAVVPIHLPPLRSRKEEIPELVLHLLERHSLRLGIEVEAVEPEAMEVLLDYSWPGNIRELENVLERAMVLADDPRIGLEDLPEAVRRPPDGPTLSVDSDDLSVKRHGARLEKHLIQRALDRTGGNKTQAAELLELSPRALRYKIQEYGVE